MAPALVKTSGSGQITIFWEVPQDCQAKEVDPEPEEDEEEEPEEEAVEEDAAERGSQLGMCNSE